MYIPETIALHQTALARIVAGLFALLGLTGGSTPDRIAKSLHCALARTLRPAESAVRRLIVFLAMGVKAKPLPPRPMPTGFACSAAATQRSTFQLFDPRPRLLHPRRRPPPARLRISFFGDGEVRTLSLAPDPGDDDGSVTSAKLVRRLRALHAALENLPRQARRLSRLLAKGAHVRRRKLAGPLRPGRPPGFRKRAREEIDAILRECDWLAREALPDTS